MAILFRSARVRVSPFTESKFHMLLLNKESRRLQSHGNLRSNVAIYTINESLHKSVSLLVSFKKEAVLKTASSVKNIAGCLKGVIHALVVLVSISGGAVACASVQPGVEVFFGEKLHMRFVG